MSLLNKDSKILKKFVEQTAWSSKSLRTFVSMSVDNLFILWFHRWIVRSYKLCRRTIYKYQSELYRSMNSNELMSQVEMNKAVIQRYFEAYNTKNEAIFDEIIYPDYLDHGQTAYMGSPGMGVAGAKNDLKNSLDKFDDLNYVVEAMIASSFYPDLVGAYWKGSLTPKSTSDTNQTNKIINARGVSIYRIQNGKMVETWHVVDGLPPKI